MSKGVCTAAETVGYSNPIQSNLINLAQLNARLVQVVAPHDSSNVCIPMLSKSKTQTHHRLTGNFFRRPSPYRINRNGMGTRASAMKPSRLLPQPTPSSSYIGRPARGRTAPRMERTRVFDARAEAE